MKAALGVTASAEVLPPALIYQGKTAECHPRIKFPKNWLVSHTESHWSTEDSIQEYVDKVLDPFFVRQRKKLGLASDHKALLIWDVYRPHRTDFILNLLASKNVCVLFIPACCTGELQPLDLTDNSLFKRCQRAHFTNWYSLFKPLDAGMDPSDCKVTLALSKMKPIHGTWLSKTIKTLKRKGSVIAEGFEKAGLKEAVEQFTNVSESDEEDDLPISELLANKHK